MSGIYTELLTLAKKHNNYAVDATGGGLWVNTTHYIAEVPASKRWFVLGGVINRAVSSTVYVISRDTADKEIIRHLDEGAATGLKTWPEADFSSGNPIILDASEQIYMHFGTAQDASSYATCIVLEVDV